MYSSQAPEVLTDDAVSEECFRSFFGICVASMSESEITDGGRDSIVVAVKIEGSRQGCQQCTFSDSFSSMTTAAA